MIAALAVETGIAPRVLMDESPRMLYTMLRYMRHRANEITKARRNG